MIQGIAVLVAFLFFALLMINQKLSALLCLIGMGITIGLLSGVPLAGGNESIIQVMFEDGSMMFSSAIAAHIFGAWLGEVMNETGITKDIIRRAAEFAGDKPFILSIVMAFVVGILFTSLQGFGATIAVGTLILPILTAAGINPTTAAAIFMISRTMGNLFNLGQWQLYMSITKLPSSDIRSFAAVVSTVMAVGILIFLLVEFKFKSKKIIAWNLSEELKQSTSNDGKRVPIIAMITPIIPFALVLAFQWPMVPSFFAGILFAVFTTSVKDAFRILTKTIHGGIKSSTPALVLLIGIGMLYSIVTLPLVSNQLLPVVKFILPTNALGFMLFFSLLAPFALYRGPMSLWGLGSGVLGLMCQTGALPIMALVAGFFAAHIIQLSGDPTNSHNIWVADFLDIEVNQITIKSFWYLWGMSIICVFIGALLYF